MVDLLAVADMDRFESAPPSEKAVSSFDGTSWAERFTSYLTEDLVEELQKIEPLETNEVNRKVISKSLDEAINAFVDLLVGTEAIGKKRMKPLCNDLLCYVDLYVLTLQRFVPKIEDLNGTVQYWNVFYFLRFLPLPDKEFSSRFFEEEVITTGKNNSKSRRLYQEAWFSYLKHEEIPKAIIKQLVPFLSATALSVMREGYLAGDFLFRVFRMGGIFAVLSLEGIFRLIVDHNFEYPDFYETVYSLTTPSVCYISYRQKFFTLLDKFLSSTHLPIYIVAAFVKRLCRLALVAPLSCEEPLLGLIRNLLTRHAGIQFLLHRDHPATLNGDPYNENEENLKECGALDSSLWEIKTLQKHWNVDVAKRASFVNKGVQRMESYVRWKTDDDYFSLIMAKKFGCGLSEQTQQEKYLKNQSRFSDDDEDDDDVDASSDEPKTKRKRGSTRDPRILGKNSIPINLIEPSADFFPDNIQLPVKEFWAF